jgi:hypothetical protein
MDAGPRARRLCRNLRVAAAVVARLCLAVPAGARIDPHDLSDDQSELELLRSLHGLAQRGDGVLILHLSNGGMVQVRDGRDCRGDDADEDVMRCVTHRLIAHFADHHAFLVRNDHWVIYNYSWIDDRIGTATEIEDLPHFSPDGAHFVVTKPNQMPGFNGVQLWRLASETPVLEFQYSPPRFALFDFRAWDNDEDVLLDMTTYVDRRPAVQSAHLVHAHDGWRIELQPEPSK